MRIGPREGIALSAVYEREFKGILTGDPKVVASVSVTLPEAQKAAYESMFVAPFLVVRAAGSLGADLVALRHDFSFLVEVKSSKEGRIHFSDALRLREQIQEIRTQCERSGVLPIYAYRRKGVRGDAWRLFTLPAMDLTGPAAALGKQLPTIEKTAKGNDVLTWENGMSLGEFLTRVGAPRRTAPVAVATVLP